MPPTSAERPHSSAASCPTTSPGETCSWIGGRGAVAWTQVVLAYRYFLQVWPYELRSGCSVSIANGSSTWCVRGEVSEIERFVRLLLDEAYSSTLQFVCQISAPQLALD